MGDGILLVDLVDPGVRGVLATVEELAPKRDEEDPCADEEDARAVVVSASGLRG